MSTTIFETFLELLELRKELTHMITKQDILNEIKAKNEKSNNNKSNSWLENYKIKKELFKLTDDNN